MFEPVFLRRGLQGVDPWQVEYTVVDVETTGLSPARGHRVCEVAAVRLRADGTVVEEFSTLVDPQRAMSRQNQSHHGISESDVAGAPLFTDVAGTLLRLMRGSLVVAHKLAFDASFLEAEFARAGAARLRVAGLCTLTAFRAQTDLRGYTLAGIVKDLSGAWPSHGHAALEDARNTARALTTLLATSPQPLRLTGGPSGTLPVWPEAVRSRPRIAGAPGSRQGWPAHIHAALPSGRTVPPDPVAAGEYQRVLEDLAVQGRLAGPEAQRLVTLASAAGHHQTSVRQIHSAVWHTVHSRIPDPSPRTVRELTDLARHLGVSDFAARDLPSVGDELKGVRIVPVSQDAAVRDLTAWAERHGATIGVRPSKTTRLVIATDPTTVPSPSAVTQHRLPVLAPAAARQWLEQQMKPAAQPAAAVAACGPLVFTGPGAGPVWRLHELPDELTAGTFTAPVRWVIEQCVAPEATFVQFSRGRTPRLMVDKSKAPHGSEQTLENALTELRQAAGLALTVKGRYRRAGRTADAALVPPRRPYGGAPAARPAKDPESRQVIVFEAPRGEHRTTPTAIPAAPGEPTRHPRSAVASAAATVVAGEGHLRRRRQSFSVHFWLFCLTGGIGNFIYAVRVNNWNKARGL
ncbi:exonuclease domain-containing protein [Streptomyces sp. NPDC093261]|uniref:3'-5' exonuclease n=1 Tax=Streptomyces sp. NPDC093261 TaxID=3366037 RepID=UPI0037FFE987